MDFVQYCVALLTYFAATRTTLCGGEDFLFMFAQEWPPSSCRKILTEGKECDVPKMAKPWLIHGLWMDNGPGQHHQTENCKISQPYHRQYMEKIKDDMMMYWPSIVKNSSSEHFWTHEWQTHGRCCTKCLKLSNQTLYFTEALHLRQKYNLLSILKEKGITPDDKKPYQTSDVVKVISERIKKEVSLRCENIKNSAYLLRIFLCFDGSLQPVNCPSSLYEEKGGSNQKCPETIMYPTK